MIIRLYEYQIKMWLESACQQQQQQQNENKHTPNWSKHVVRLMKMLNIPENYHSKQYRIGKRENRTKNFRSREEKNPWTK